MSNQRFPPRAVKFLELYFSGFLMKDAVALAGYKALSPQSRCNTGSKILKKLEANPEALFRQSGARERKLAQLLVNMTDNESAHQQLKALKILARYYFS